MNENAVKGLRLKQQNLRRSACSGRGLTFYFRFAVATGLTALLCSSCSPTLADSNVNPRSMDVTHRRDVQQQHPVEVDDTSQSRWFVIKMHRVGSSQNRLDIELLRPESWVVARGLKKGVTFHLDASQKSLSGLMQVDSMRLFDEDQGAPFRSKDHRMITGRFVTQGAQTYLLRLTDGGQLRATGNHPLYSLDRGSWVSVADLRRGERLRTRDGEISVASIEQHEGTETVYNLEVQGEHVYFVGHQKLLAHNDCEIKRSTPHNATVYTTEKPEFQIDMLDQARRLADEGTPVVYLSDVHAYPDGTVGGARLEPGRTTDEVAHWTEAEREAIASDINRTNKIMRLSQLSDGRPRGQIIHRDAWNLPNGEITQLINNMPANTALICAWCYSEFALPVQQANTTRLPLP